MSDQVQNFSVNNGEYRGSVVHLDVSYQHIIGLHTYPAAISQLLGQALAAISLFGLHNKQAAKLALQLQSVEPIKLLVVEINHLGHIRGLIQWPQDQNLVEPLRLHSGQLLMTITAATGDTQQGVIPIVEGQLSNSLSHYFSQSEQIHTSIILVADSQRAAGLFIQKMPDFKDSDFVLSMEELQLLLNTLRDEELLTDSPNVLLGKLFYQHEVMLHECHSLQFKCNCTYDKMADAVRLLGYEDALSLLNTHKTINVTCEFCNQSYDFDEKEVTTLFQKWH